MPPSLGAAGIGDSDVIVLLSASSALSGAFANVANNGQLSTPDGSATFFVHYGPGSAYEPNRVVLTRMSGGPAARAPFFNGEVALSNGVYYLQFPGNGSIFGYYSYLSDPRFIFHFDLGYEYWFDAGNSENGVFLYDFASQSFFYTSPSFRFPYLYDFSLGAVLYYFPDPNSPGRYNTNGVRYFYNYATGQIIVK